MIGRVLKGIYKIYDRIATGGFATVYVGRNTFTNEIVAIKVLSEQYTREERYVERFRREAMLAERLHHTNIVRVLDHGVEDEKHYLVMEFVEGLTLETMVDRKGALPIDEVVSYARQVCAGLQAAADAGIIHRDIKPANLMITPDGMLKIMDFGIARIESLAGLTQSGMFMGTPRYISPEIAQGAKADVRSDLYAFGLVMYEMLAGAPPFDGASPWAVLRQQIETDPQPIEGLRPDVPPWLRDAVIRLLAKDPDQRFQTPSELLAVLESQGAAADAVSSSAARPVEQAVSEGAASTISISKERDVGRGRRKPLIIGLVATAAVVIIAVSVAFALGWFGGKGESTSRSTVVVTSAPTKTAVPEPTSLIGQATDTDTVLPTEQPRDTETPTSTRTELPPVLPTDTATAVPPTPTDTPTSAPQPTETLAPTPEPTATDTPTAEPTATPRPSPRPTNTPGPTATATNPPGPVVEGRIALSSGGAVYIVEAATGNTLAGPVANMRQPDFEPGGQQLIANGEGGGTDSLWTISAGGGLDREQSEHPDDFRPYFSPSNPARFVFDSTRLPSGDPSLFAGNLNSKGENRDPLNHGGGPIVGSHAIWLANDMVIYAGCDYGFGGGSNCGLFSVPSWGGVPHRILAGSRNELPSDGFDTQILFTSQRDGNWEVYLINADGSGLRNLSSSPGSQDGVGTFSPDGSLVAFVSNRGGAWAVWVVKKDGTALTKLFNLPGPLTGTWTDERISWAP